MTKQKRQNNGLLIFIAVILLIGIVVVILALQKSTNYQQHASSFNDLNSVQEITSTNNPDGTMGGVDTASNFSNTLPSAFLGTLNFRITDPLNGRIAQSLHKKVFTTTEPKNIFPTQSPESEQNATQGKEASASPKSQNRHNAGSPAVTSLVLTVMKVEVHLAHLAVPGEKLSITPTLTPANTQMQGTISLS